MNCPNCQVKYKHTQKGIFPCPKCQTTLQLLEEEEESLPEQEKAVEEEPPKKYQWRCATCNKVYTTKKDGKYQCPTCKNPLESLKDQEKSN